MFPLALYTHFIVYTFQQNMWRISERIYLVALFFFFENPLVRRISSMLPSHRIAHPNIQQAPTILPTLKVYYHQDSNLHFSCVSRKIRSHTINWRVVSHLVAHMLPGAPRILPKEYKGVKSVGESVRIEVLQ